MFAEELETHDVNALARTCREMNELLARFVYLLAKDSRAEGGRPYFLLAVDDGNLAAVERFVEVGASVNMTDTVTRLPTTAIHSCAHFGHVEIAEFLIDKGINVSAVDRVGRGALHSLVKGRRPKEAMMTLLVEAGADMNQPWYLGTPLHVAARRRNVRMVQRLLDLGADPHAGDWDGSSPAHKASDAATVRCLLEAGQNVEIVDNFGRTPLHRAAQLGRTEIVKVLLEMGADTSSSDRTGNTPLLLALFTYGNEASIHRILHLRASMVNNRFREMYADCVPSCQLKEPNHMAIELLLAAGADIAQLNYIRYSPLRWAMARAHITSFPRAQETRLQRRSCLRLSFGWCSRGELLETVMLHAILWLISQLWGG